MFGKFNSMIGSLGSKLASKYEQISEKYQQIATRLQKRRFVITEVEPRFFHIEFPTSSDLPALLQHSNGGKMQIWNISEYDYEEDLMMAISKCGNIELVRVNYQYYANIPLFELISCVGRITQLLTSQPKCKVYLHCQDSKTRSAVLFASYLFINKRVEDISEGILMVGKVLGIRFEEVERKSVYRAQHNLLRNLANFRNNPRMINRMQLKLLKIMLNNCPRIKLEGAESTLKFNQAGVALKLEIKSNQKLVHKSFHGNEIIEGESVCFKVINQNDILLTDQFLVIIKYVTQNKAYNVLRVQLNTNFIFNQYARVTRQDMDISTYCIIDQAKHLFIDFIFEEGSQLSHLAQIQSPHSPKRQQEKKEYFGEQEEISKQTQFSLHEGNEGEEELNEKELQAKIERVMQTMQKKEKEERESEEEQDLDDYLSKLQESA